MKRRAFLKTSVTASALAAVSQSLLNTSAAERSSGNNREFYELRAYRLKPGADHALLDSYLEHALIPALNRLGAKPVGAFVEQEPKDGDKIWVLIPYSSVDSFSNTVAKLTGDSDYLKSGAEYLSVPKDKPGFDRIDSWFLLAFGGMPKIELPPYSRNRQPRIFELRTYESYSEAKALKKIDMFNSGDINVMPEVGLAP